MKKLILLFCIAFLAPNSVSLAHQEKHVHSQWIKQKFDQLHRTIRELQGRIERLEKGGAVGRSSSDAGGKIQLDDACSAAQQKLCERSCPPGWKIENAACIGRGGIGKTYHKDGGVLCYCFDENDPSCTVERVTASCIRP